MRVCIVSKFPPIEGGIASRTYWRVRDLLDTGHDVAVVTNSGSVEPDYRIAGCERHLEQMVRERGLLLRDVAECAPWHIPDSPDYLERLLNALLEVLSEGSWDVIESGYLVPYGVAGHIASLMTGVPHVVRHGGSDVAKFLDHPEYRTLLREVLSAAEVAITDDDHESVLRRAGARTQRRPAIEIDEAAFATQESHEASRPRTYAYVGKVNYHWRRKGLDQIIEWYARQNPSAVSLRLVGQGVGAEDFASWASTRLEVMPTLEPFVPPWEMPQLLASVDAVFALNVDDIVVNRSRLAAEAKAIGVDVIQELTV